MLILARAFTNKPGQKGSTDCFNDVIDLFPLNIHLIVVQDEGWVDAGKVWNQGDRVGKCWVGPAGLGGSCCMKLGPHPSVDLPSSEGLRILAAAKEKQYYLFFKNICN